MSCSYDNGDSGGDSDGDAGDYDTGSDMGFEYEGSSDGVESDADDSGNELASDNGEDGDSSDVAADQAVNEAFDSGNELASDNGEETETATEEGEVGILENEDLAISPENDPQLNEAALEEIDYLGFHELDADGKAITDTEDHEDNIAALEEQDYDTSDYGRGNKSFDAQSVGELTDTSSSKAAAAGHAARDDMSADNEDWGIPADRHNK
jgi:hypothetical protein